MKRFVLCLCLGVVAALAFSVASASAVTAGSYTGQTAQKRAVSFTVSGNRVHAFSFQARWTCSNGTGFVTQAIFRTISIHGQHFSGAFANKTRSLATTIRGGFKGSDATGTIRRRARFDGHRKLAPRGKLRCSVSTGFTAHRG